MGFVSLDTDVASLAFRRRLPATLAAKLTGHTWCLTYVTVAEMTQWATIRSWGSRNRGALDVWLDSFVLINSSADSARMWASCPGRASALDALIPSTTRGSRRAA
jgi:hypothetical protein